MKKVIVAVTAMCCCINLVFSQNTDSLKTNSSDVMKNEFGITFENINLDNILILNLKNVSLQYKRRIGNYSVRAGIFYYNNYYKDSYFGFDIDTLPISNPKHNLPNVEYRTFHTVKTYGGKIGLERNKKLFENTDLFYGLDINISNISNVLNVSYIPIVQDPKLLYETYLSTNQRPSNWNYHGYQIGLVPFLGVTQHVTQHFSASVELDMIFNYIKYYHNTSMLNNFDTKAKVILSYRI